MNAHPNTRTSHYRINEHINYQTPEYNIRTKDKGPSGRSRMVSSLNYSHHGNQWPGQPTVVYGDGGTSMGQNGIDTAFRMQHQQYQSRPQATLYRSEAHREDGVSDYEPSHQHQYESVNSHQQLRRQIIAQQKMNNEIMQQQQQQQTHWMMQPSSPDALHDHNEAAVASQGHQRHSRDNGCATEPINDYETSSSARNSIKKRRLDVTDGQETPQCQDPAARSYVGRNQYIPQWMNGAAPRPPHPPHYLSPTPSAASGRMSGATSYGPPIGSMSRQYKPIMREIPEGHLPTWDVPLPLGIYRMARGPRRFELSLVNVKEFTITGVPMGYDKPVSSLDGLRKKIKEISKEHGVAVYERGKDGEPGKWRIPLVRHGGCRSSQPHLLSKAYLTTVF